MPSTLAWHCPSELHCVPQAGPAHLQHQGAGSPSVQHTALTQGSWGAATGQAAPKEQLIWGFSISSALSGVWVGHEEAPGGVCGCWGLCQLLRTRPGGQGLKLPQLSALLTGFPGLLVVWHSRRDAFTSIWRWREDAEQDVLCPGLCGCGAIEDV